MRRSPSWGAWIEIAQARHPPPCRKVAPPRGERGLKCDKDVARRRRCCRRAPAGGGGFEILGQISKASIRLSRSPAWGAWIEMSYEPLILRRANVAPPRGERGLEFLCMQGRGRSRGSLPLVGSVD